MYPMVDKMREELKKFPEAGVCGYGHLGDGLLFVVNTTTYMCI